MADWLALLGSLMSIEGLTRAESSAGYSTPIMVHGRR